MGSRSKRVILILLLLPLATALDFAAAAPLESYRVIAEYPHDRGAYTEGLLYEHGRLFESTGRVGHSTLREVELKSGRVLRQTVVAPPVFAEGIAHVGDHWLQLTWTSGFGFIYDNSFRARGHFRIPGEGWGMTYDGHRLIESDGSSTLHFLDPKDYSERGELTVRDGAMPVRMLNELEAARGLVYANVFLTDLVAIVDPGSGQVKAWWNLSPLRARFTPPPDFDAREDVPNGIAYDEASGHFFVTGKCWPKLFEIAPESPLELPAP